MPISRKTKFAWLLAACVLLASAGGGCSAHRATRGEDVAHALDGMRAAAKRSIRDEERLPLVQQSIDGLEMALDAFDASLATGAAEFESVNADPDASRLQIEALLDRVEARRKAARQRILQTHFELIALTDTGEWAVLAPYERKALIAAGR